MSLCSTKQALLVAENVLHIEEDCSQAHYIILRKKFHRWCNVFAPKPVSQIQPVGPILDPEPELESFIVQLF